ncbi:MAG: hypothetical protein V4613_04750 [Bacteroidota bacterium]
MKLINVSKYTLLALFALVFFNACVHVSERDRVTGRWQYMQILKADSIFIAAVETDFLELSADSTFRYEILLANKKMTGKWGYNKHRLELKYDEPDTTRYFDVEIISDKDFIITENDMKFVLKRQD